MLLPVACVQLNSQESMEDNIAAAAALVKQAADGGAKLVALPENAFRIGIQGAEIPRPYLTMHNHPGVLAAQEWARQYNIWLLIGSVALVDSDAQDKPYNRLLVIAPTGGIAAHYDKIHLFDAALSEQECYRESERIAAGARMALANIDGAIMGLSVCYDVRFAHLFRAMAKMGAQILAIPAAFARTTGEAHWHVLLRARAIETGCFVLAPAQCGTHPGGRQTYGHSLIIDPWGRIIAEAGEETGLISATLDLGQVSQIRQKLPSLQHDKDFL